MSTLTSPELDPEVVEQKRKVAFAKGKYVLFIGGVGCVLFFVCLPLTSEALRTLLPFFGNKLSKTPILGGLFGGPSMAKLDTAYVAAGVIYAVVIYFWTELLALWLDPDASIDFHEGLYKAIVTICGIVILIVDGLLMYCAVAAQSWGTLQVSFVAIGFTLTYLVGLIFASLVSMRLKKSIKKLEEELL